VVTTTTLAAVGPPSDGQSSFFGDNWWWLTIVGLALIAMIATIALLQPQLQGAGGRDAPGVAGGRHVKRRAAATPRAPAPTVSQRVRRTKVAQNITMRSSQPKPPKPSMFRRMTNWMRDTEVADTFRARSDAKQVKSRTVKKKPPKIKRRR
jgi:hypothetical protein